MNINYLPLNRIKLILGNTSKLFVIEVLVSEPKFRSERKRKTFRPSLTP